MHDLSITPRNEPSSPAHVSSGPAVLAFGFRIFFLLAALSALGLILAWVLVYTTGTAFQNHFDFFQWHGHEMLFGYTAAVIAGFLLTAPATWTGLPMPSGLPLAGLALLWLAGRILPFFPSVVPAPVIAFVDIVFLPAIAASVFLVVWKARRWNNIGIPVLLLGMAAANAMAHARMHSHSGAALGTELMIYLVLLLIVLIAGRVVPFFVRAGLPGTTPNVWNGVEGLSIALLALLIPADLLGAPAGVVVALALLAAAAHSVRLVGWCSAGVFRTPLLWILFTAYGWLILGFLLKAGATLGSVNPSLARHAFTAGGIGVMTLGMMCRVTLGHTGRQMRATWLTTAAFLLLNLSVVVRVVLPMIAPAFYLNGIKLSALTWVAAFAIFLVVYGPMLVRPRVDGEPG